MNLKKISLNVAGMALGCSLSFGGVYGLKQNMPKVIGARSEICSYSRLLEINDEKIKQRATGVLSAETVIEYREKIKSLERIRDNYTDLGFFSCMSLVFGIGLCGFSGIKMYSNLRKNSSPPMSASIPDYNLTPTIPVVIKPGPLEAKAETLNQEAKTQEQKPIQITNPWMIDIPEIKNQIYMGDK